MYLILDHHNFIKVASWGGILEGGLEVEDFEFTHDMQAYQYVNGEIVLDETRLQHIQNEQLAQEKLQELQAHLTNTAAIVLQRFEESELGLEHQTSDEAFGELLRERQETRMEIRRRSDAYPNWMPGVHYQLGDIVRYNNELYQVLQNHTSANHWRPSQAHSLYRRMT